MPTYDTHHHDGSMYQSSVTIVDKEGTKQTFVGEMAEGKKNAEHRAASKALESLGRSDEKQAEPAVKLPSKSPPNPMPHKARIPVDSNPDPASPTAKDLNPNPHKPKSGDEEDESAPGKMSLINMIQIVCVADVGFFFTNS